MEELCADLKLMLQQQLKLMETLTAKLFTPSTGQSSSAGGSQSVDSITSSITELLYDPQAQITFDSWYKRYEDVFSVDLAAQEDAWKVRLLSQTGSSRARTLHELHLPNNPRDISFADTLKTLSQILGDPPLFLFYKL